MTQGPNVKKLIVHKMSLAAVPAAGGIGDALNFLKDPERIMSAARDATAWVEAAILAVRMAEDPNPWKTASDEAIAAEILHQIEAKKRGQP